MLYFVRVAVVMMCLHSNRNPKTEGKLGEEREPDKEKGRVENRV